MLEKGHGKGNPILFSKLRRVLIRQGCIDNRAATIQVQAWQRTVRVTPNPIERASDTARESRRDGRRAQNIWMNERTTVR